MHRWLSEGTAPRPAPPPPSRTARDDHLADALRLLALIIAKDAKDGFGGGSFIGAERTDLIATIGPRRHPEHRRFPGLGRKARRRIAYETREPRRGLVVLIATPERG